MIIDSHAHLLDEAFDLTRQNLLNNMRNDNLMAICEVGFDIDSSEKAVRFADDNKNIFAIIGTHPENAMEFDSAVEERYRKLAQNKKVIAFGEIGLDYHYDTPSREIQKEVFLRQLVLADSLKLPIVLHIRDAYGDCLEMLNSNKKLLSNGVLLHCYCGSAELVERFCKLNCYFALGGIITFKNTKKEDVIRAIPLNRLLLETDCPFMAPTPFRGEINQPKYTRLVLEKLADTINMPVKTLEDIILENTTTFFNLSNFVLPQKEEL